MDLVKVTLAIFLLFSVQALSAPSLPQVQAELVELSQSLLAMQKDSGEWIGAIEADPTADIMPVILQKKLGLPHPKLVEETLERIFKRQDPENGLWPAYPGGPPSVDVTGMILLGLHELGIEDRDPKLERAWKFFSARGGISALGDLNKMICVFAGIIPPDSIPTLSPKFFAFPKGAPINVFSLGFGRAGIVPLAVWRYYHDARVGLYPAPEKLAPERISSKGSKFGHPLGAPIDFKNLFKFHKSHLIPEVLDVALRVIPTSADFWAQEGIGWILDHQQKDGTWAGALQITFFSILALHEAQLAGVADFTPQINAAWQGLMGWRTSIPEGSVIQQSTIGPVMDTARILTAFGEAPQGLGLLPEANRAKAVKWLLDHQLFEKGDWTALAPQVVPGAWTFEYFNSFYPDSDDTGMVIEALSGETGVPASAVERGLRWLAGMQNRDGGFPTWDRGTSDVFHWIAQHRLGGVPDVSDRSQGDITSRVLNGISSALEHDPSLHSLLDPVRARACAFLSKHRRRTSDSKLPLWRGEWMVDYLYGTSQAINALLRSGCWTAEDARPYVAWILSKQNSDGGFGESPESYSQGRFVAAPSTLTQTEFVLTALMEFRKVSNEGRVLSKSIDSAIDYLLQTMGSSLHPYESEFTGVYVRGVWYGRYLILPHYEAVRVLGTYLREATELR